MMKKVLVVEESMVFVKLRRASLNTRY